MFALHGSLSRFRSRLHSVIESVSPSHLSTAQEQSNVYPSHSYNTSLEPPPSSVSPPAQEDLGGSHKNGDPSVQDHAVVNFTTPTTTCDTITIHTGRAVDAVPSLQIFNLLGCFFMLCCPSLFPSIFTKKDLRHTGHRPQLRHTDRLRR